MDKKVDLKEFRELLKKSIGARSQAEFAKDCSLSPSHMTRMLNDKNSTVPQVKTIRNIAKVAANGVTLNELLVSAGYEAQEDKKCVYSDDGNVKIIGITEKDMKEYDAKKEFREQLIELREIVRPYDSFNDVFGSLMWECESMVSDLTYTIDSDGKATEEMGWHKGADYFVKGKILCEKDDKPIEFGYALYYCKTDMGKIIICDTDWE